MPKQIRDDVQRRLAEMAVEPETRNLGPKAAWTALCREFGYKVEDPTTDLARLPIGLRTVQAEWPRLRTRSVGWRLRPNDPDPAFTLRTLAWLDSNLAGRARTGPLLDIEDVAWLRVVHSARPDFAPEQARRIANAYLVSERLGEAHGGPAMAEQISIRLGGEGTGEEIEQRVMELFPAWSRP